MSKSTETLGAVFRHMEKDAVLTAKEKISDEEMNFYLYAIEREKAKKIMRGAMVTILRECDLYGEKAIFDKNARCNNFFTELADLMATYMNEVGENKDDL